MDLKEFLKLHMLKIIVISAMVLWLVPFINVTTMPAECRDSPSSCSIDQEMNYLLNPVSFPFAMYGMTKSLYVTGITFKLDILIIGILAAMLITLIVSRLINIISVNQKEHQKPSQ